MFLFIDSETFFFVAGATNDHRQFNQSNKKEKQSKFPVFRKKKKQKPIRDVTVTSSISTKPQNSQHLSFFFLSFSFPFTSCCCNHLMNEQHNKNTRCKHAIIYDCSKKKHSFFSFSPRLFFFFLVNDRPELTPLFSPSHSFPSYCPLFIK